MRIIPLILCLVTCGCMSLTVPIDSRFSPAAKPSYTDYMDTFLLGLIGTEDFNLTRICVDQKPYGFQRIKTFEDGFLTFVTMGIYSPTTINVWCGDGL